MPNPDSQFFPEAFGITKERQQAISLALDEQLKSYGTGPGFVPMHHFMAAAAKSCQSGEELMYATILHCGYLQKKGILLTPGSKKDPYYYGERAMYLHLLQSEGKYFVAALDSTRLRHVTKELTEEEWREAFTYYSQADYPMYRVQMEGSDLLYEIKLP